MRFIPYAREDGLGFAGPMDLDDANALKAKAQTMGYDKARVTTHCSMVQTSDNSPIVVNIGRDALA